MAYRAVKWEKELLKLVSLGYSMSNAARAVGIYPSTVTERKKRHPEFAEKFAQAQDEALDRIETMHMVGAASPKAEWRYRQAVLSKRRRDDWGDSVPVVPTGPIPVKVCQCDD